MSHIKFKCIFNKRLPFFLNFNGHKKTHDSDRKKEKLIIFFHASPFQKGEAWHLPKARTVPGETKKEFIYIYIFLKVIQRYNDAAILSK